MIPIRETLAQNNYLLYDAAKGTNLDHFLDIGTPSDILNITAPYSVESLLRDFVSAGSRMVQTCTFRANTLGLDPRKYNLTVGIEDLNTVAAQIARSAAGNDVYVAGDLGPSGLTFTDRTIPVETLEKIKSAFIPQVRGLIKGGVDLIHIETQTNLDEMKAIIEAVRDVDPVIPIMGTMTFHPTQTGFRSDLYGIRPAQLITLADEKQLLARGANCGTGLDDAELLVKELHVNNPEVVLVVKLNAGKPKMIGDITIYPASHEDMAEYAVHMRDLGVKIIGACCGSTPKHLEAMANALSK